MDSRVEEGLLHHRAGRLEQAAAIYAEVLKTRPDEPDALHLMGVVVSQRGDQQKSVELISRAIAIRPGSPKFHLNLAVALRALGRFEEALRSYSRSHELDPTQPAAKNGVALCTEQLGRRDEAVQIWRTLLELFPNFFEGWTGLGLALKNSYRSSEALPCLERAAALAPNVAECRTNFASVLNSLDRFMEALAEADEALRLKNGLVEAKINRAEALRGLDRLAEAERELDETLALAPGRPDALVSLHQTVLHQANVERALRIGRQIVATAPQNAKGRFSHSLGLLLAGQLEEGLREYEWRLQVPDLAKVITAVPGLPWRGEPLGGRTILVHGEQGVGDTLQFVRFLPQVVERGGRVLLRCQRGLVGLLRSVAGVTDIFADGDPLPHYDVKVPLMSLPHVLRTPAAAIPAMVPYVPVPVVPGPIVPTTEGERMRVGLVWAGNPIHKNDRNRSMPVETLASLFEMEGIRFVSLQVGQRAADIDRLPVGDRPLDLSRELTDYTVTAGVINQLDLVITVDTSVAHLAGALGRPAWTLLPFAPDWRWMLNRPDSPWYPTMRLFRQPRVGAWAEVVEHVREELVRLRDPS